MWASLERYPLTLEAVAHGERSGDIALRDAILPFASLVDARASSGPAMRFKADLVAEHVEHFLTALESAGVTLTKTSVRHLRNLAEGKHASDLLPIVMSVTFVE